MALPIAALSGALNLVYFGWFDIVGDVVRATTFPGGYTFGASETGDPDLDGKTFFYIPHELVQVGDAVHSQAGSDTMEIVLSGLAGPNDTLLGTLDTRANWQGRIGRLWHGIFNGSTLTYQAGYYTGYMTQATLSGDPQNGGRVKLVLDNYLSNLTTARFRTYQDQAEHDPGDLSGARIRASANGIESGTGTSGIGGVIASAITAHQNQLR